jgi:hypothetical protein
VWAVPAAAAAAAVFAVGVLAVDRALAPHPPSGTEYVVAGTVLAEGARGEVSVLEKASGFSIVLHARDLPAAAPGSYYAVWLKGEKGIVPIGSYHGRQGTSAIELWSGVDPADYPMFMVTLQAEGRPPVPSDLVVLSGMLTSR